VSALKVGDKILILEDHHNMARVFVGDILEVTKAEEWYFQTEAPRIESFTTNWDFNYEGEGTGWERYEA
jgi:hypothetical protein